MIELPLEGFCVGVTADRRWEEQAELLSRRGASILHGPSIRTLPLGSERRLLNATEDLIARPPDHVVANTGIGIRSWFAAAESWGLGTLLFSTLQRASVHARGPKASGAIHAAGLDVAFRANGARLREVVDHVLSFPLEGRRIAFQRDGAGPSPEADRLRAAGADVVDIPVYEWRLPGDATPALRLIDGVVTGRVHAVTFTSAPALRNLLEIARGQDMSETLRATLDGPDVTVGCVGPVCAEAAEAEGINDYVVPTAARLGPLIRAVTDQLVARARLITLSDDTTVSLRGSVVRVGDRSIELGGTEARLLALLAARPGAVLTKTDLLHGVWGDAIGDTHVVEVTIGRIRRRLGAHASAIRAVPRRGYRLDTAQ